MKIRLRIQFGALLSALVAAGVVLAGPAGGANAAVPATIGTAATDAAGFYYELRNSHTNNCADVTYDSPTGVHHRRQ